ncbi:putative intracellular protease/amidase [Frankia sp. EI5c]|uniref:type 1 glutamine amidotransferase domain-containing protein n=1 Tax=Frankia sp. EI5c TaxID=683316 RepID=UPI0007C3D26B|nr:type 1 glutamine amidotransferase domain-containing protein [Frankia sp. EI5c]OAA29042.1 putative intracellular protease/amidase [Frankia sp. EI5c]
MDTIRSSGPRVLVVVSSWTRLGDTGRSTGFWLPEAAYPWWEASAAGYRVDIASIAGGRPQADGVDHSDPVQRLFLGSPDVRDALARTPAVDDVDPAAYQAVFLAGGYAAMWDMPRNAALGALVAAVWSAGGVVNAVCHGPAGLLPARRDDGAPLVQGLRVTGFSRDEEHKASMVDVVPLLLPDALTALGARYESGRSYAPRVVVDSRVVTGQNPASAPEAARITMRLVADAGHKNSYAPGGGGH